MHLKEQLVRKGVKLRDTCRFFFSGTSKDLLSSSARKNPTSIQTQKSDDFLTTFDPKSRGATWIFWASSKHVGLSSLPVTVANKGLGQGPRS